MRLFLFALLFFTVPALAETPAETPVEREFYKFFKTKLKSAELLEQVNDEYGNFLGGSINVAPLQEDYNVVELKIEFGSNSVEKVLILREKDACTNTPVFIGGYSFDPKINTKILFLRMQDHCAATRLVVFVKKADHKQYFVSKASFKIIRPWISEWDYWNN